MEEQSTTTSSSGNWILALPILDTATNTLLNIYVQAGTAGIATAQIYVGASNPVPPITLGKTYDFLSSTQTTTGGVPDSSVTLPSSNTATEPTSRFNLNTNATPQPSTSSVTVKSIEDGETIYTTNPEFFGAGPKGTNITVTLHSTVPITQNITVASDGSWKWSPPTTLEDGSHTLTITWRDAQGALQTLTKNFTIVANAQEPSFVSTPSGTLAPTPTSSALPTTAPTTAPTLTPSLKPSVKPTVKPTITPENTATPAALPTAGSPFATLAFISTGIALLLTSVFLNFSVKK
jgi:hypothetical protein